MLEIFAFPYFVVSGVIGWLIYKPFFHSVEFEPLSPTKITITDLLATSFPVGIVFSFSNWLVPPSRMTPYVQLAVITSGFLILLISLAVGLFLTPRTSNPTFAKRLMLVGVVGPFGVLLAIGWVGLLIWSGSYSIMYLAPVSFGIGAATWALRCLSLWMCASSNTTDKSVIQDKNMLKKYVPNRRPKSRTGEALRDLETITAD